MSLKELTKLIALCRKQGVLSIKLEGVELQLGPVPTKEVPRAKSVPISLENFDPGPIHTDMPTNEQMLFWSADAHTGEAQ